MNTSRGQALYGKARSLLPGGSQLLSKRPEQFAPGLWPPYYERAVGCTLWDLDGNRYTDMTSMGIGSCILGYACPEVNEAVRRAVDAGSMTTLNCAEEVELAELLLELHPWAAKVRYARTGGEIMSVAVRIARASTGRDQIAFCGYHGWHDWYLAANLADNSTLDEHLLPGLSPKGVPRVTSYSTQIADVAIDPETGQVKVLQILAAVDVAEIVNPVAHRLQIEGGMAMGFGFAMMEDLQIEEGRVTAANLGEFKIPSARDLPALRVELVPGAQGIGAGNVKAIGEVTNIPVAAAIANAVADATGVRVRDLPITAERVWSALQHAAVLHYEGSCALLVGKCQNAG